MVTRGGDRPMAESVLVDTNVLLEATSPKRRLHRLAHDVLEAWPARDGGLCLSGQVLREYLVVATRPPDANGLGLGRSDALGNAAAFAARCRFLAEGPQVTERLWRLLQQVDCLGKQIHDANLVATALVHGGVTKILTANADDFARFADRIEILPLADQTP